MGVGIGASDSSSSSPDAAAVTTPSVVTVTPPAVTITATTTVHVTASPKVPRGTRQTTPRPRPTPSPTHRTRPPKTVHVAGVPAADLPRAALTPGAILTTSAETVCVSGYASSVRDVPDSLKEAAYARYGVVHVPYAHEVDHLISLELGGSNALTNLWPEPYAGRWGARTKDTLENKLHDLVCSGSLTLRKAQHMEATNWVVAYRKYVGSPPAPAPPPSPPSTSQPPPPGGNCEPGYSPCLPRVYDLDCGEISDSLKPIDVTGDDSYGLDGDGDGIGCEV